MQISTTRDTGMGTMTNGTVRRIAAYIGVLLSTSGLDHGSFEMLQGNTPTSGLVFPAIGADLQQWKYGGEPAFSVIPNFLVTGIAAVTVSILIIITCLRFLDTKHGPTLFIGLFVLLTLVGGGIGYIPFFVVAWAYTTRINKPLDWWRKRLSPGTRSGLARIWPYSLAITILGWAVVLDIAILGYIPGLTDPEIIIDINWTLLLIVMVGINLSFVSGIACDLSEKV